WGAGALRIPAPETAGLHRVDAVSPRWRQNLNRRDRRRLRLMRAFALLAGAALAFRGWGGNFCHPFRFQFFSRGCDLRPRNAGLFTDRPVGPRRVLHDCGFGPHVFLFVGQRPGTRAPMLVEARDIGTHRLFGRAFVGDVANHQLFAEYPADYLPVPAVDDLSAPRYRRDTLSMDV